MNMLLPRLAAPLADRMLDRLFEGDELRWHGFDGASLPDETRFASTGGSAVDAAQLQGLRDGLAEIATAHGFGSKGARTTQAAFDSGVAAWLAQHVLFQTGEALRDDIWSFIGVVMAPDIVHWRFGSSRERYTGGIRNALQRLWMRARVLDRGAESQDRWGLLDNLTEDALVQITERPSIGADAVLSRELAEAWVRASDRLESGRMEAVMRLATLRLRIRNEIRSLSYLPKDDLARLLDQLFDEAAEFLGATPTKKPKKGWDFWRSKET